MCLRAHIVQCGFLTYLYVIHYIDKYTTLICLSGQRINEIGDLPPPNRAAKERNRDCEISEGVAIVEGVVMDDGNEGEALTTESGLPGIPKSISV